MKFYEKYKALKKRELSKEDIKKALVKAREERKLQNKQRSRS